jgi:hypothetical protein
MGYVWSWSWGSESAVLLQSDMGFEFSNTAVATFEPRTTEQYKPTGAPTKYSMACDINDTIQVPLSAVTGLAQGVISLAVKNTGVATYSGSYPPIKVEAVTGRWVAAYLTTEGAIGLYIDNVFKATSALSYDWTEWRFLALHFDISADPWKGRVTVDGVEAIPEFTDVRTASTVGTVAFNSPVSADRAWYNGQIIVQDAYADAAPPRFVTRISPDADVSTVGTWTPTSGSNFASTGVDPFDAATNTAEATPTIGDEVITGYTGDLTAKLGIVPGSVDLVTVHSYSTGLNNTARAEVGDQAGSTTTAGSTELIGLGTTYAYASAPVAPGDSLAWEGTDTPKAKYEVVGV